MKEMAMGLFSFFLLGSPNVEIMLRDKIIDHCMEEMGRYQVVEREQCICLYNEASRASNNKYVGDVVQHEYESLDYSWYILQENIVNSLRCFN